MTGRPVRSYRFFSTSSPSVGAILMTNRVRKRENILRGPSSVYLTLFWMRKTTEKYFGISFLSQTFQAFRLVEIGASVCLSSCGGKLILWATLFSVHFMVSFCIENWIRNAAFPLYAFLYLIFLLASSTQPLENCRRQVERMSLNFFSKYGSLRK